MPTGKEIQQAVKTRFEGVVASQRKLLALAQKLHKHLAATLAPTGFRPIGDQPNEGTYYSFPFACYTPVTAGDDNNFFFITKIEVAFTNDPENNWCEVTLFGKPYECVNNEIPQKFVDAVANYIAEAVDSSTSTNWVTAEGLHKRVETHDWEGI